MTPQNTTKGWKSTRIGSNSTQINQAIYLDFHPKHTNLSRTDGSYPEGTFYLERDKYFEKNYDVMTGIRIAGTLGGFFLLVLVTLLYKSKCKKSSPSITPIPQGMMDHQSLLLPPSSTGQDDEETLHSSRAGRRYLMEMNEIDLEVPGNNKKQRGSPRLLLTTAEDSSESSAEFEDFIPRLRPGSCSPGTHLHAGPRRPAKGPHKAKSKTTSTCLQGQIDIRVTVPTPTISPSQSNTIREGPRRGKRKQDSSVQPENGDLQPPTRRNPGHSSSKSGVTELFPLVVGSLPPFFSLVSDNLNLKYVDDTSSENIVSRASDNPDFDGDEASLGSDSVFTFCSERKRSRGEASLRSGDFRTSRILSTSRSHYSQRSEAPGSTLTTTHVQVHFDQSHRDSVASSELDSVTDYLESQRRRSSSTQTTLSDLRACLRMGFHGGRGCSFSGPPSDGTKGRSGDKHDGTELNLPPADGSTTSQSSSILTPQPLVRTNSSSPLICNNLTFPSSPADDSNFLGPGTGSQRGSNLDPTYPLNVITVSETLSPDACAPNPNTLSPSDNYRERKPVS